MGPHSLILHILPAGLGQFFLLEYPHGLYLIDCSTPGKENILLARLNELGRSDLRLIWITHAHYDHYGSAARLRELTGARIGVHPADADFLARGESPLGSARGRSRIYPMAQPVARLLRPLRPTPPDFTLEDGQTLERFGLDATVLHTPGHTPGHTCLVLGDGTAFAADLIASSSQPHLQNLLATHWESLPGSLRHLQNAQPRTIYSGHSRRPISGAALQHIQP
ncbi:MBL fold metallo-hydrolase [Longilinea arvoryzae]|nr:MBL fold metallo-hydrolase [Longilinea arvoryzae]